MAGRWGSSRSRPRCCGGPEPGQWRCLRSDEKGGQEATWRDGSCFAVTGAAPPGPLTERVEEPRPFIWARGGLRVAAVWRASLWWLSQKSTDANCTSSESFPPRACGPFSGTWWHPGIDNQTVAPNRWKGRATGAQANPTKALKLKNRNSKEVLTPELIYLSPAIIMNRNKSLCRLLFLFLSMLYRHPVILHAYYLTS